MDHDDCEAIFYVNNEDSDTELEERMMRMIYICKLQNNKSGDHFGLIYELFKPEIIGKDLFESLLLFCNEVKNQQIIPKFLQFTDITSI